jgi:hypothetical protein
VDILEKYTDFNKQKKSEHGLGYRILHSKPFIAAVSGITGLAIAFGGLLYYAKSHDIDLSKFLNNKNQYDIVYDNSNIKNKLSPYYGFDADIKKTTDLVDFLEDISDTSFTFKYVDYSDNNGTIKLLVPEDYSSDKRPLIKFKYDNNCNLTAVECNAYSDEIPSIAKTKIVGSITEKDNLKSLEKIVKNFGENSDIIVFSTDSGYYPVVYNGTGAYEDASKIDKCGNWNSKYTLNDKLNQIEFGVGCGNPRVGPTPTPNNPKPTDKPKPTITPTPNDSNGNLKYDQQKKLDIFDSEDVGDDVNPNYGGSTIQKPGIDTNSNNDNNSNDQKNENFYDLMTPRNWEN